MQLKILRLSVLALGLFTAAFHISARVVPQAQEGHLPFSVGAGVSTFDVDWGRSRMLGGTF
jgi:hypothetical protein